MLVWHDIEDVDTGICSVWYTGRLPLCKAALTVNNTQSLRYGMVLNMIENTKEIPVWVGEE